MKLVVTCRCVFLLSRPGVWSGRWGPELWAASLALCLLWLSLALPLGSGLCEGLCSCRPGSGWLLWSLGPEPFCTRECLADAETGLSPGPGVTVTY